MTEQRLKDLAYIEATKRRKRYNEERRASTYQIAPFVMQNFLAGVDFAILVMREEKESLRIKK